MDLGTIGYAISVWLLPVLVAITFHEAAHGWMAERFGDPTARSLGRVTFNPIKHVDPFGTLILPGLLLLLKAPVLFGYAKPVPVNFARLNHPKRDMIWVALAGPGINIILAYASALGLRAVYPPAGEVTDWLSQNLANSIQINIMLAVFNLLPIPPLDGGRVLTGLLPHPYAWRFAQLERYGLLILLGLLFIVPVRGAVAGLCVQPDRLRAAAAGRVGLPSDPRPRRVRLSHGGAAPAARDQRRRRPASSSTSRASRARSTSCWRSPGSRRSIWQRSRSWRWRSSTSPISSRRATSSSRSPPTTWSPRPGSPT